jgi:2-polyprenyl-3-methyl-5-hydroxy-6-metoxy-1,4-benzoquinol methylase
MRCIRSYPIVVGIPDFRVYPDVYVPVEQDYLKAGQLQEQVGKLDFVGLISFYWEHISKPPTPMYLRERFIRHTLSDEARARRLPITEVRGSTFLDVGCGPGGMQTVANERFDTVFGTDIALRSLVVARKRLDESGLPANLICCCADYLPFKDKSFDLVTNISVLEHTFTAAKIIVECGRVTKETGAVFFLTTNRFSLGPEPHVRIWGLGFVPRKWMAAVVKRLTGRPYDKHHLLSLFEMRRFLKAAGFQRTQYVLPEIEPADLEHRGSIEKAGARVFIFLGRIPFFRHILLAVAPILQVTGWRGTKETVVVGGIK